MDLLLEKLISDEKKENNHLYSSGKYWKKKNLKTIYQLKKKKLTNFRGLNSGVGTSFADNLPTDIGNELNFAGRIVYKLINLPLINKIFLSQTSITLDYAKHIIKYLSVLYKKSHIVEKLIKKYKFEDTVNFGCCQKFTYNNKDYSNLYLEIANRVENISNYLNLKSYKSYFEIGGGFGANVDFIISNFPNIKKIIYLDSVPNLYVGTMYLKKKYNDNVKDYLELKDKKINFSNDNNLEIFCIAPWQIVNLDTEIDHFHNASSFVEMPKYIIKNYLKYIFKNDLKSISLVTYKIFDPNTTIDPYSLNSFFDKKLDVHEFPTAVEELSRKDIYYIKNYDN